MRYAADSDIKFTIWSEKSGTKDFLKNVQQMWIWFCYWNSVCGNSKFSFTHIKSSLKFYDHE
jgi:hypothetical protein